MAVAMSPPFAAEAGLRPAGGEAPAVRKEEGAHGGNMVSPVKASEARRSRASKAEKEGFEPSRQGIPPPNALAGRRLQPLGHFSERETGYRNNFYARNPSRISIKPRSGLPCCAGRTAPRRGGRAVECGGLENRFGRFRPTRVQIPPPPLSPSRCTAICRRSRASPGGSRDPRCKKHYRTRGLTGETRFPPCYPTRVQIPPPPLDSAQKVRLSGRG